MHSPTTPRAATTVAMADRRGPMADSRCTSTRVTGNEYDVPEGFTSQSRYTLFRPSDCPNNRDHLKGSEAYKDPSILRPEPRGCMNTRTPLSIPSYFHKMANILLYSLCSASMAANSSSNGRNRSGGQLGICS